MPEKSELHKAVENKVEETLLMIREKEIAYKIRRWDYVYGILKIEGLQVAGTILAVCFMICLTVIICYRT